MGYSTLGIIITYFPFNFATLGIKYSNYLIISRQTKDNVVPRQQPVTLSPLSMMVAEHPLL